MAKKTKFIPGFRFHPTDQELVLFFLKRKVMGKKFFVDVIAEVDIYKYAPWDLPDKSSLKTGDLEWYFFCPTGKKYASGLRMNRATEIGYWKTTGRDRPIKYNNRDVGMIKTLVFHTGRAPRGDRTDWVMHEYRLEDEDLKNKEIPQDSYVLCRVFQKDGVGPRNGAQYGKPFDEEDWDDDKEEVDCVEPVPFAALPSPVPVLPISHNISVATEMHLPASGCIGSSSASCLSGAIPSHCLMHPSVPSDKVISKEVSVVPVDDGIFKMLDPFTADNTLTLNENIVEVGNPGQAEGAPCLDVNDIFKDLGELDNLTGWGEDGRDFSCGQKAEYTTDDILPVGDSSMGFYGPDFLELRDLGYLDNLAGWGEDGRDFSCGQKIEYATDHIPPVGDSSMGFYGLDYLELLDLDPPLFSQTKQHEC